MGLFDSMLSSDESLIIDDTPLDFDYVPKLIKYRENEQFAIAKCFKPLFNNRTGRNMLVYGPPGVGKSVAIRNVIKELETETDSINIFYVNCWQHNTTFKILIEISNIFGYHFTQNKKTIELYKILQEKIGNKNCVFIFDEIDRVRDNDFLYFLLEKILRKSIILITNYPSWLKDLDRRVKSRLTPQMLEFKDYNKKEITGILLERRDHAFSLNTWQEDAFNEIIEKTHEIKDIRSGLFLMREAGLNAEEKSSKKITKEHVEKALSKLEDFTIKKADTLDDETKFIFDIVKDNSGLKIGDLYKIYQDKKEDSASSTSSASSYKTFQRKVVKLAEGKFVTLIKQTGKGGNTTIVDIIGKKY